MMDTILLVRDVILYLLRGYYYLMIVSILLSWVRPDPRNPVVRFINRATQPVFDFFRTRFPFLQAGMIDFSPIVPILLLELLAQLVGKLFDQLAISAG